MISLEVKGISSGSIATSHYEELEADSFSNNKKGSSLKHVVITVSLCLAIALFFCQFQGINTSEEISQQKVASFPFNSEVSDEHGTGNQRILASESYQVSGDSQKGRLESFINKNPISINESRSECQLIRNLIQDEYFKGSFDFGSNGSESQGIRVSLLASSGLFQYKKDNSGKLFFVESQDAKVTLFEFLKTNPTRKQMPYLSVIGKPGDVNEFLNESMLFCGANPSNRPYFLIENYVTDIPDMSDPNKKDEKEFLSKVISQHHRSKSYSKNSFVSLESDSLNEFESKNMSPANQLPFDQSEDCESGLQQEKQKQSLCLFRTGEYKTHQGNFSMITLPLKQAQEKPQNVSGRIVTSASKHLDKIRYIPVCHQKVVVLVRNQFGKEIELASAVSDPATGEFTIPIPYVSSAVSYVATLKVKSEEFSENIKQIHIGGGQLSIFVGNIHLTNPLGKPKLLGASSICSQTGISEKSLELANNESDDVETISKEAPVEQDVCKQYNDLKEENKKACPYDDFFSGKPETPQSRNNDNNEPMKSDLPGITASSAKKIDEVQFRSIKIKILDVIGLENKNQKPTEQPQKKPVEPSPNAPVKGGEKNPPRHSDHRNDNLQFEPTSSGTLSLYRNHVDCHHTNSANALYLTQIQVVPPTSETIIHNQSLGDYTLQIKFKSGSNYHSVCKTFTVSYDESKQHYEVDALIVQKSTKRGGGIIVLENRFLQGEANSLPVTLGASVIFNENIECLVSTYNRQCEDFKYMKTPTAQAISFDNTYSRNHLFFVQKLPSNEIEQDLVEESRVKSHSAASNENRAKKVDNSVFVQQDLSIKVYVPESEYEVAKFSPPSFGQSDEHNPVLTWMAMCFDGSIGLASLKPVNQYYESETSQRKLFPNANFCEAFFQSNPYEPIPN